MRASLVFAALVAAPHAFPAGAQEPVTTARGRVLDARGRPAAGVELATVWTFDRGRPRPSARTPPVTAADGRFSGAIDVWQDQMLLLAFTDDGTGAGLAEVGTGKNEALEIALRPTVRVHGSLTCSQLTGTVDWSMVYMTLLPGKHRIGQCLPRDARFELRLPPGEYELYVTGADLRGLTRRVVLGATSPDLDLGALDVPVEYFALMRGKELPEWTVSEARGVPLAKSKLSDFRGRWLVVEFWGCW